MRRLGTGDLDLELVTKPIPRKLGFLSAIAPLSDSIGFLSNVVVVKVCTWTSPRYSHSVYISGRLATSLCWEFAHQRRYNCGCSLLVVTMNQSRNKRSSNNHSFKQRPFDKVFGLAHSLAWRS